MDIRAYRAADASPVAALLTDAAAGSATRRHLWDLHGPEQETPKRRTLVAADAAGQVVGVGSVFHGRRHPARVFTAVHVRADRRRRGVGTALLEALRAPADGLPLRVRTVADDTAGRAFLAARGCTVAARCRTGRVVSPTAALPALWRLAADRGAEPAGDHAADELVLAHARRYEDTHRWDPPAAWSLDEARRHFGGTDVVADSACVVREADGRLAGVAILVHDRLSGGGSALLVDLGAIPTFRPDAVPIVAALTLRCLRHATSRRLSATIEVDEANRPFWTVAHALPVRWAPDTLIHVTDGAAPA